MVPMSVSWTNSEGNNEALEMQRYQKFMKIHYSDDVMNQEALKIVDQKTAVHG